MKKIDLARAMRDEDYYLSLSDAERASLPVHPAAPLAVSVSDLKNVTGAKVTSIDLSCGWSSICTPCPPLNCSA